MNRIQSSWGREKDFEDKETGLVVRLNSMVIGEGFNGVPDKKRFSFELGMIADGEFTRYFRMATYSERNVASMPGRTDGITLSQLITAAEVWVIQYEQARLDALTNARRQRLKGIPQE